MQVNLTITVTRWEHFPSEREMVGIGVNHRNDSNKGAIIQELIKDGAQIKRQKPTKGPLKKCFYNGSIRCMDGEIMGRGVIEKGQRQRGCLPSSELCQSIKK